MPLLERSNVKQLPTREKIKISDISFYTFCFYKNKHNVNDSRPYENGHNHDCTESNVTEDHAVINGLKHKTYKWENEVSSLVQSYGSLIEAEDQCESD